MMASMVWFLRRSSSTRLGKVAHLAVNASAKALLIKLIQQILKLALAASHNRRHDRDALAAAQFQDALHDLLGGLAGDGPAAVGAVGRAHRGVKQAQIVVDFGDGANGRPRAAAGGFLLDGDGRAQALDGIHIGPLDLVEKLARVGRKRLDIAALALGVDGVKGERTFARAGEAGDDREGVAGNAHVDVAQVVLARPAHRDVSDGHGKALQGRRVRSKVQLVRRVNTPNTLEVFYLPIETRVNAAQFLRQSHRRMLGR